MRGKTEEKVGDVRVPEGYVTDSRLADGGGWNEIVFLRMVGIRIALPDTE